MKKNKAILAAILMAASVSSAQESGFAELLSTAATSGFTSAPTATLATTANSNDILMVNQDAVIAMETGFVSDSLASVIEMLKASEAQFAAASDADIIKFILDLNQTAQ